MKIIILIINNKHIKCENMATKISQTPTLDGEDARRFLESIEKPKTKKEKEFHQECIKAFKSVKFTF